MANLDRLKKKSSMGAPPSQDEASNNLEAPEVAPAAELPGAKDTPAAAKPIRQKPPSPTPVLPPRVDGRTMRRSGRVVTFATRVTAELDTEVRRLAKERGLLIVEVLEEALEAYKKAIS